MRVHRPSAAASFLLRTAGVRVVRGRSWASFACAASVALATAGCSKDKASDPGAAPPAPPPPVEVTKAGACASGGGQVTDPISAAYFPRTLKVGAVDWCVDPQGETRTYG